MMHWTNKSVGDAKYFLLSLDANAKRVDITGYSSQRLESATEDYLKLERNIASKPNAGAVLVSLKSLGALGRAYPSYFLDTKRFLNVVREVTK
jgi:hypothetical protein